MADTSIIVPCYNEAERLNAESFLEFSDRHSDVVLRLVNDGSQDRTAEILAQLAQDSRGRIQTQSMETNVGKAEAVRQGMIAAAEHGYSYVGFWDADLATPLGMIPQFVQVLKDRPQLNAVIGSRMPLLGRRIERHPLRSLCGRVFATAASVALGLRVFDTQCGAKLFRANDAFMSWYGNPFISRWIFDVEVMARMRAIQRHEADSGQATFRESIYELPLDHWHDVAGSKLKSRDFAVAIWELLQITRRYRLSTDMDWAYSGSLASEPASQPAIQQGVHLADEQATESPAADDSMIRPFVSPATSQISATQGEQAAPIRPRRAA